MNILDSKPLIVVLQPEEAVLEHWTERLELGDHLKVFPARRPNDVFQILSDKEARVAAFLLPWPDPEFDPSEFFQSLRSAKLPQAPCVMALARSWEGEVAARAARIGVHSFLNTPLSIQEVLTELIAIRKVGSTPSAARLFGENKGSNPGWRKRMMWLASNVKREGVSAWERRVRKMLEALDQADGGELCETTAEMLLLFAQRDHRQLDMMLSDLDYELSFDDLKKLYGVAEHFAGQGTAIAGNEARLIRLLEGVVAFIQRRSQARRFSEEFTRLREVATIFLGETRVLPSGQEPPEQKNFRLLLANDLEVSSDFLLKIEPERLRRLAAQIVRATKEERALDLARMTILAFILKHRNERQARRESGDEKNAPAGIEHLKALSEVLGGKSQSEIEVTARLKELGEEISRNPTGLDETPELQAFQSMFNDFQQQFEDGDGGELGLDSRAISRGLTALKISEVQEDLEEEQQQVSSSLLGRLSSELDLPKNLLDSYDTHDLLDRLPTVGLDVELSAGALARVRLSALLVIEAQSPEDEAELLSAFARSHQEEQSMLAAFIQTLSRSEHSEKASRFKSLLSQLG